MPCVHQRALGKAQAALALCVLLGVSLSLPPHQDTAHTASTARSCDWTLSWLLVAQVAEGSAGGLMKELVGKHPSILGGMVEAWVPLGFLSAQQD